MPRRVLATWLIQALVLLVLGWLLPGVEVDDPLAALLGSAVIAGLNALVRPIIVVLTLPLTVATFGLLSLIINTSMVVLAAPLVPGLDVAGFLPALALALILTVVTTTVNVALAIDEDVTFYAELARRIQTGEAPADGPPGWCSSGSSLPSSRWSSSTTSRDHTSLPSSGAPAEPQRRGPGADLRRPGLSPPRPRPAAPRGPPGRPARR